MAEAVAPLQGKTPPSLLLLRPLKVKMKQNKKTSIAPKFSETRAQRHIKTKGKAVGTVIYKLSTLTQQMDESIELKHG